MQMERLQNSGYDFQAGTRAALEGKFGGASDVLLRDLSEAAKSEPRRFAEELFRIFGRGSIGFLEPIAKYAQNGLFPPTNRAESATDALLRQLGPGRGATAGPGPRPLHEWRIRDQEGKYPDEAD